MWAGLWPLLWPPRCALCTALLGPGDSPGFCAQCLGSFQRLSFPVCLVCGRPLSEVSLPSGNICGFCIESEPYYDAARLYGRYEGALAEVLKDFKFREKRSALPALSGLMLDAFELYFSASRFDLVLPVPLHRSRLGLRGFNQAADLAGALAKSRSLPLRYDVLVRTKNTLPQYGLTFREREKNIKGAFKVNRPSSVHGSAILLIDDIITTGTTVDECARTLRKSGASSVYVLCLAGSFSA